MKVGRLAAVCGGRSSRWNNLKQGEDNGGGEKRQEAHMGDFDLWKRYMLIGMKGTCRLLWALICQHGYMPAENQMPHSPR